MRTELQERADILVVNLQRSMDACFEVLQTIGQLYGSSYPVGPQEFRRFVRPTLSRHPSIHALEWLPRLLDSDRPEFEQTMQAAGFDNFQVTEWGTDGQVVRAGQRLEYFPVAYVEPLERNELALGFDLASDETRRLALEKARDTGAIAVSGRVELVQEEQKQFGVLVILPIYHQGEVSDTITTRRQHLLGCVLGVFRIADIVQASLPGLDLDQIDLYLYDKADPPGKGFLARYEAATKQVLASPEKYPDSHDSSPPSGQPASQQPQSERPICTRTFAISDRQWSLLLAPTPAYVDHAELYNQSRITADAATAQAKTLKLALQNLQHTQARWLIEKKLILAGVGMVLLILGGANWFAYRSMTQLLRQTDGVERSNTILVQLARLLWLTTDAELEPAPPAGEDAEGAGDNSAIEQELATLQQAVAVEGDRPPTLERLNALIAQQLAIEPAASDNNLQVQIRQAIDELEQQERSRLIHRKTEASDHVRDSVLINILSVSLSFILLMGGYYLLQRQISERQTVEAALWQANDELETKVQARTAELATAKEISELKLRLFSMVSHEFRTPLSTILVSTQLLSSNSQDWSDEKRAKNLVRIQSAAKTLAQLLSDILTLNRAEAGKLEFRPEAIDIQLFCRHLVEDLQLSIGAQPPIQLTLRGDYSHVWADGKLLQSILSNLLSNAAKYSSDDDIVWLTVTAEAETVTLQVQDRGIGILPEDQQRLYESFYRGQNVGNIAGTGLGLAVVKTCVELHKGEIHVASEVGQGTTFTVVLPQQRSIPNV